MKKPVDNLGYQEKFIRPNDKILSYLAKSLTTTNNIIEGSWRSSKSVTNIQAIAMNLELSPNKLHLAIGKTDSSAQEIIFENDGLGLKYWPDWQERVVVHNGKKIRMPQRIFEGSYKNHSALVLMPRPGSDHPVKYIVALGGGKADSYMAFRGWGVGMVIATEIDLLHKETMNELKGRTIASKHRRNFWDFNPTDPNHYIYKDYVDFYLEKNPLNTNYLHTTLDDNPSLDQDRKEELKGEFPEGSPQYRRFILGERVVAEGLIYELSIDFEYSQDKRSANGRNALNEFNPNHYADYVIISDPGINSSATAFVLAAITRDYRYVDVLHEYRHRNFDEKVKNRIKRTEDYANDFLDFIHECTDIMGRYPSVIASDNDVSFLREVDRLKESRGVSQEIIPITDKDEIDTRINTGVNYLFKGRLRFYKDCKWTVKAYKEAKYDPKETEKGKYVRYDKPPETEIDNLDAVEYAITAFRHYLVEWKGKING